MCTPNNKALEKRSLTYRKSIERPRISIPQTDLTDKRSSLHVPATTKNFNRVNTFNNVITTKSNTSTFQLNRMNTIISNDQISSIIFKRNSNMPLNPVIFSKFVDKFLFDFKVSQGLNGEYSISDYREQYEEIYNILNKVCAPSIYKIKLKSVFLSKVPGKEFRKTVIFDLDETLIHACDMSSASQINIQIFLDHVNSMNYGLLIRPYAIQCLKKAKELYEVVVFTASEERYARAIIDYLDPDGEIFDHCLFQNSCINVNGFWVKDLRIFMNRKMKDLVIVDNFMPSYLFQLENGIPITTWTGEFYDKKLLHIIEMLEVLKDVPDVRQVIRQTYGLKSEFSSIIL